MEKNGQLTFDDIDEILEEESYCACGCGEQTEMSKQDPSRRNTFVNGHNNRGRRVADGARSYISGGYLMILVSEDDPYFSMAFRSGGSYYIKEHRLVMARWIHRALRPTEIVHHENGDKMDNRIENLKLFHTTGAHSAYHRNKEWAEGGTRR